MDKDSIIREWFYRLPKGYANAPYSKEELNILHTVLEENGLNGSAFVNEVDQLDQAFNDAEEVDTDEKKHTLEKYEWQKPHQENLTGTDSAYYPNKNKDGVKKKYSSWKE